MTGPPAPLRRSVVRALAVTALTVAALGVGPAVGSAFAAAQFSVNDPGSQFEGNTITFQITCTDTGGPPDDCDGASVDFATSNDTATAGADYDEVATTTVGFMGVGSEFINVTTIDDNVNENDETFFGDLTNDQPCCANSDIIDNRGTGIILDEEFQQQPSGNADLAVGKAESADPARVGDDLVYTIAVHNFGPSTASNVTMFDTLPGNVQFISAFPTFPGQGFCSFNGVSTVTCSIGTIVAGSTHFFDVRVRPTAAGTLQNTASASSSSNFDPFGGNNSATTLTATFVEGTTPPAPLPSPGVGSIAALRGPRICSWSEGSCVVLVDCTNLEQDCTAVGRGRVFVSGRAVGAASYRFRRVQRTILAGEEEALGFRVGFTSRRKIRRALRNGRRVRARVRVTVTNAAGNRTVRRRSLRVTG